MALSTTRVVGVAAICWRSVAARVESGLKPCSTMVEKCSSGARRSSKPHADSAADSRAGDRQQR